jgi:hypothetical protein
MSLLIQYDFSSSSFLPPNVVGNIAPGDNSYIYNAIAVNNPMINIDGPNNSAAVGLSGSPTNNYISVPQLTTTNAGTTFTFWFQSNNNPTWARIFDFGKGGEYNNNIIAYINDGYLGFSVYQGGNAYQLNNVIPNINNNTAYFVAWVINYPQGWTIYLNGSPYYSDPNAYYPIAGTFLNTNYIGKSNWSTDPYFSGIIADFRMYNGVLQQSDIQSIYSGDQNASSQSTGDIILNTGFNELYNQIFCDLFSTNNGFNQCQNCNFGNGQIVNNTSTQQSEQDCLNACKNNNYCTSYTYNSNKNNNNCTQYNSFPDEIVNGVSGVNAGYSVSKFGYDYNNLSGSQQTNVQTKCFSQYLNNQFTPNLQLDTSSCLSVTTTQPTKSLQATDVPQSDCKNSNQQWEVGDIPNIGSCYVISGENSTYLQSDPKCVYDLYLNNGLNPKVVIDDIYNNNPSYNLSSQGDPVISNYESTYNNYINTQDQIANINNNNLVTTPNDGDYIGNVQSTNDSLFNQYIDTINQKNQQMTVNLIESFENEMQSTNMNSYVRLIIIFIILIISVLFLYIILKNK